MGSVTLREGDIMSKEYSLSDKYFFARSHLSFLLFTKKMFYTRALLATVDTWKTHNRSKGIAYIGMDKRITVSLDNWILDECIQPWNISDVQKQMQSHTIEINEGYPIEVSPYVPMIMVFHEIRHIPQVHAQTQLASQILLPEIQEKLKQGNRPMHTIVNICMDMTLHRDILKVPEIKVGFDQLCNIVNEQTVKELLSARTKENATVIDERIEKTRKGHMPLAIVEKFNERFVKPEGYEDYFEENLDWATLTNIAYLRLKDAHEKRKEQKKKEESKCSDGKCDTGDKSQEEGKEQEENGGEEQEEGGKKPSKRKKPSRNRLFDDDEEGECDCGDNGFDEHDFEKSEDNLSDEEKEEIRKDRARRLDQAMREAEVVGKEQSGKHGGSDPGDQTMFVKEKNPDNHIVKLISRIKSKVMTLSGKPNYECSWKLTRDRSGFCVPTERERGSKKTPSIVLVLDVSGSMWNTDTLSQSFTIARALLKRGKLAALYQGDTVLTRCDKQAGRTTGTIIGGGGTELSLQQIQQIRADLKLPANEILDVVYVTDGYVDLREIQADQKTRLHVVLNRDGDVSEPRLV